MEISAEPFLFCKTNLYSTSVFYIGGAEIRIKDYIADIKLITTNGFVEQIFDDRFIDYLFHLLEAMKLINLNPEGKICRKFFTDYVDDILLSKLGAMLIARLDSGIELKRVNFYETYNKIIKIYYDELKLALSEMRICAEDYKLMKGPITGPITFIKN